MLVGPPIMTTDWTRETWGELIWGEVSHLLVMKVPALCAMIVKGPLGTSRAMRLSRSATKSLNLGFGRAEAGYGLDPLPEQSYASRVLSFRAARMDPKIG